MLSGYFDFKYIVLKLFYICVFEIHCSFSHSNCVALEYESIKQNVYFSYGNYTYLLIYIHKYILYNIHSHYTGFDRKNMLSPVKTSMYFSTPFPKTPLRALCICPKRIWHRSFYIYVASKAFSADHRHIQYIHLRIHI